MIVRRVVNSKGERFRSYRQVDEKRVWATFDTEQEAKDWAEPQEPLNYMNAQWVNGPRLVEWLESAGAIRKGRDAEGENRRIREWRAGAQGHVESSVDRMLCGYGLHLFEIPNECFEPRKEGERKPQERLRNAVRLYKQGETVQGCAKQAGVSRKRLLTHFQSLGIYRGPSRSRLAPGIVAEIKRLGSQGWASREIAHKLEIAPSTVNRHLGVAA